MALAALARITDLFVEGKELVLRPEPSLGGPPAVLAWVNKLNAFEQEDARRDGAVARARMALAVREVGSAEKTLYESLLLEVDADQLRAEIVDSQQNTFWMAATNAIRVDPVWAERYLMVQRPSSELTEAETTAMTQVTEDYFNELQARAKVLATQAREDLQDMSLDQLKAKHRDIWIDGQAMNVFGREYNRTRVFFALRTCRATTKVDGRWDHTGCDHSQRTCDSRDDALPDALTQQVLAALLELDIPADDARFSAGAADSSTSSPRPSDAEASRGQEVTLAEPPTTS